MIEAAELVKCRADSAVGWKGLAIQFEGGQVMMVKEMQSLRNLVWHCLADVSSWQLVTEGSAGEIMDLAARSGINEPVSIATAQEFVDNRDIYLTKLKQTIEAGLQSDFGTAVSLFRKGLRVMDNADPTYYGAGPTDS